MPPVNWKDHFINFISVILGVTLAFLINSIASSYKQQQEMKLIVLSILEEIQEDIAAYEEYQIPALYLMLFAASMRIDASKLLINRRFILLALLLILLPWARVYVWAANAGFKPYLPRLSEQKESLYKILPAGQFYPLDAYLALGKRRIMHRAAWLGQFSYLPDASDVFVKRFLLHNRKSFAELLNNSEVTSIYIPDESMKKNTMTELLAAHPAWARQPALPACFPATAILWLRKS